MSAAVATPEEVQLPKAVLKRMMKKQLAQSDNAAIRDANISADAMLAVSEAAKVFISYLTCTANDICAEHKRSTISPDDVLSALEELEFGEFCDVLRSDLERYRTEAKEKASAAKARRAEAAANTGEEAAEGAGGDEAADGEAMDS